jgi:3-keto-disaccharide hydrolase
MKRVFLVLALLSIAGMAQSAVAAGVDQLNETERKEGFRPLLNGKDLTGWKLRNANGHPSWSVKNGILVNDAGKEHGTDLVTVEKFKDFTVRCEYMIPKGANSGLYLRGRHEIQILDDYEKGQPSKGGNGAIYNQAPVSQFASKKAGEWQTVEATIKGNRITVVLNGVKVHDQVESSRPTGGELDGDVNAPGPIMLQGDHGSISLRNIRIKELK